MTQHFQSADAHSQLVHSRSSERSSQASSASSLVLKACIKVEAALLSLLMQEKDIFIFYKAKELSLLPMKKLVNQIVNLVKTY